MREKALVTSLTGRRILQVAWTAQRCRTAMRLVKREKPGCRFTRDRSLMAAIGLALFALVATVSGPAVLAAGKDNQTLRFFSDGSPAGGVSQLERDGDAGTVSASVNASHLMPGGAYTYWYVIFNRPAFCIGPCGDDDLFLADGVTLNEAQINAIHIAVLGGNGKVANNGGHTILTGTIYEDSALGQDVLIGPDGLALDVPFMLEDADNAEIHIVVRNHGPAQSGADLAEQLLTFWGNCTNVPVDDDPTFPCMDEQFAVHLP